MNELGIEWHLEKRKLSQLKDYDKNPRRLSKEMHRKLKANLERFGIIDKPCINLDGTLIGGHQRKKVFKEMGLKDVEVWVPERELDEKEIKDLNVALNKLSGDFDMDILGNNFDAEELLELGFGEKELADILPDIQEIESEEVDDEAPEPPKEPETVKGDLWELGDHRLLCGDCIVITDVEKLFNGQKADQLVTDPPYGVDYSSKNEMLNKFQNRNRNRNQTPIENDSIKDYKQFFYDFLNIIPLKDTNTCYIFMLGQELHTLRIAFEDAGFKWSDYLVWVKNNHVLGRKDYNAKHEFCMYGWKGKHKFYAKEHRTTILNYSKPLKNDLHPTMKPVELIMQCVEDGSDKGHIVYDPFCGSGTTLIACESTKRKCYATELSPKYCDVIRDRYIKHCVKNGKEPIVKLNGALWKS